MASMTIWNGCMQGRTDEEATAVYSDSIHTVPTETLESRSHDVHATASGGPDHGLTEAVLDDTDALIWWGHKAHGAVKDMVVEQVYERIYGGVGFVPLYSMHLSKMFRQPTGTSCLPRYRESDKWGRVWTINPGHPIADGLDESFVVPETEMYGEPLTVSEPNRLVFVSWLEGGEVFRSGCCYRHGNGWIFYFRPGHETYPVYEIPIVREILGNTVRWAATGGDKAVLAASHTVDPVEWAMQPRMLGALRDGTR